MFTRPSLLCAPSLHSPSPDSRTPPYQTKPHLQIPSHDQTHHHHERTAHTTQRPPHTFHPSAPQTHERQVPHSHVSAPFVSSSYPRVLNPPMSPGRPYLSGLITEVKVYPRCTQARHATATTQRRITTQIPVTSSERCASSEPSSPRTIYLLNPSMSIRIQDLRVSVFPPTFRGPHRIIQTIPPKFPEYQEHAVANLNATTPRQFKYTRCDDLLPQ
ncbi:hypothetical protein FPV67DRAFT_462275 [Lyophyllum atratum]|nr:hypothetical protein FPV67DRAFT_462275 [Lyophyllum atratum]